MRPGFPGVDGGDDLGDSSGVMIMMMGIVRGYFSQMVMIR